MCQKAGTLGLKFGQCFVADAQNRCLSLQAGHWQVCLEVRISDPYEHMDHENQYRELVPNVTDISKPTFNYYYNAVWVSIM